jgi:3-deoxy-D-manno-octulosonic-acid transferase
VEQLLARNGARQVSDSEALARSLIDDLNNPEEAAARGQAGRKFVLAQNGASGRTLLTLDRLVDTSAPWTKMSA